jgi:ORF6N domain
VLSRCWEGVKCNIERFPQDFMLRLSDAEYSDLISQIATSKPGRGGRRKLPWAFTEHGAIQAVNVLNSARAIAIGGLCRARFRAAARAARL